MKTTRQTNVRKMPFWEGKAKILKTISTAFNRCENQIIVVHGYNQGTAFRTYLDSVEFKKDCLEEYGICIKKVRRYSNPGDSLIVFDGRVLFAPKDQYTLGDMIIPKPRK